MANPYLDPNAAFPQLIPGQAPQLQNISAPKGRTITSGTPASAVSHGYNTNLPNIPSAAFDARNPVSSAPTQQPTTLPGNNYVNPGLGEQAFNYSQNLLLNDPWAQQMQQQYAQTQQASQGESFLNNSLGGLSGPGQGDQYWQAQQGQYMTPMAGEQFARQATQAFAPQGQANAFNNQAQGSFNQLTQFQGAGNAQSQYGASSGELGGGTQAEANLAQLAGGYSQYGGGNNALGQYQQNAQSGPLAAQSFYDQVGGSYGDLGQYQGGNLSAGQYAQTQQAFGDLPIADFDPYYDRAIQKATQTYNQGAAGRGVYGSSEALSGVGNLTADLNAQRARDSFSAEMQRAQEQRARQQLLGEQANMGDNVSLAAFQSNLNGLNTFGQLANNAGNQTLNQQTMLGNQARAADQTGLDAFGLNTQAATAYANINNQMGQLQLDRNRLLGDQAMNADTSAQNAQNSNIAGMTALGNIAQAADTADANRYTATTNAMNNADVNALNRMNSGVTNALAVDANTRANFDSQNQAAYNAANLEQNRVTQGANIAQMGSNNDLNRVSTFNTAANAAESSRQGRLGAGDALMSNSQSQIQNILGGAQQAAASGNQAEWDNYVRSQLLPQLEAAGYSKEQAAQLSKDLGEGLGLATQIGTGG
jgi:hypothetical protein